MTINFFPIRNISFNKINNNKIQNPIKPLAFKGDSFNFSNKKETSGLLEITKKLQKNDIKINFEDINEIFKESKCEDVDDLYDFLRLDEEPENVGQAFILARLLKNGTITFEKLNKICSEENDFENFTCACEDFTNTFNELGNELYKSLKISSMAISISAGEMPCEVIKPILENIDKKSEKDINNELEKFYEEKIKKIQDEIISINKDFFNEEDVEIKRGLESFKIIDSDKKEELFNILNHHLNELKESKALLKENKKLEQLYKEKKINKTQIGYIVSSFEWLQNQLLKYMLDDDINSKINFAKIREILSYPPQRNYLETGVYSTEGIFNLIKKDKVVNSSDATNIILKDGIAQKYQELIEKGFSSKEASVLANVADLKNYSNEELKEFLKVIRFDKTRENKANEAIDEFFNLNPDLDLKDFNEFAKEIDFDKLTEIAPTIKTFTPKQYLDFINFHYLGDRKTNLTKEDLIFSENFTHYLSHNFTNADELTEIMAKYPATNRFVGALPKDWVLKKENSKELKEKIDNSFENFINSKDKNALIQELEEILKTKTKVNSIGAGQFGIVYKIAPENKTPICLKIYYPNELLLNSKKQRNTHGCHIEAQTALFANYYSNDFVKMYFGKVAPLNCEDGYIATQFLDEQTKPIKTSTLENSEYIILSDDVWEDHNMINDKIIDYGGVQIRTEADLRNSNEIRPKD